MTVRPIEQLRQQFISEVARQTGVDPHVVDYWTTREGAYAPGGTGGLDFLNLRPYKGDPYQGVSPGGFEQFTTLPDAVAATVRRIKQPFLQQYLAPALGGGADAQWKAIATSGWDAGHYGMSGLGHGAPVTAPAPSIARAAPAQPDLTAARASLASFLIGNLQQHGHSDPGALVSELEQLKPLITPQPVVQPAAPVSTPAPSGLAEGGSAPSAAPAGNLAAVPDMIATRPGIQVDGAILPAVSRITQAFGVHVSSGYRSPEHNAQVGGAPDSDHLQGHAVDFVGSPDALAALHAWAEGKFPYVEPLDQSRDHVHISFIR